MRAKFHRFDLAVTLGSMALLAYFAWHAFHGPRGYPYHDSLALRVEKLTQERDAVEQERRGLEARVALMRPESVDPDMLEELARTQLEMSRPNDLIVRFPQ